MSGGPTTRQGPRSSSWPPFKRRERTLFLISVRGRFPFHVLYWLTPDFEFWFRNSCDVSFWGAVAGGHICPFSPWPSAVTNNSTFTSVQVSSSRTVSCGGVGVWWAKLVWCHKGGGNLPFPSLPCNALSFIMNSVRHRRWDIENGEGDFQKGDQQSQREHLEKGK